MSRNDDNFNGIGEEEDMNDARGGKDVASFKQSEMISRTSTNYLNDNNDSISEFDVSTCPGDNFYDIFENEDEIITEDSIFFVNNS